MINESHSYTLTSVILKVDIVCDVAMTPTRVVISFSSPEPKAHKVRL